LRLPRFSSAVGAGFAVWGVAIGLIRLHDNSFLTELATGHLILSNGFPHSDPFSFTAHGRPWVLESWLASVLYGWVDDVGGAHGLQLLHAALAVALSLLVWRLTRPANAVIGRILAATAVFVVGTGYWTPRPLLIGLVGLACIVLLSETEGGSPWLAVPVMWIWIQDHGSWPLGLAYLLIRLVARAVDHEPLGRLPSLVGAVAIGILLGAANPYGLRLLAYPLVVLSHHQAFSYILEWQSPSFSDPVNAVFLAEALLALLLAARRRGTLEDALVTVLFVAAACLASRNIPVASLVIVPVLSRGLAGLGSFTADRRTVAAVGGILVMAVFGALLVDRALQKPGFVLNVYPVVAVAWMQQHGLVPGRVATQDYVGNFLEYRYGARASAFIDDRVDMYPAAVETASRTLLAGSSGWQSALDRYRIRTVLWQRNLPLGVLVSVSPKWQVVYRDTEWVVAVER
jgi:hypothetical protein